MQVWTLQVSQALLWQRPSPLKITGTHLSTEVTETRGAGEHIAQCFLLSHFWLESYWALPSSGLPLLLPREANGGQPELYSTLSTTQLPLGGSKVPEECHVPDRHLALHVLPGRTSHRTLPQMEAEPPATAGPP